LIASIGIKCYILIGIKSQLGLTCGIANRIATSHMMMISFTALESFDMLCAMNGWQIATYRSAVNAVMVSTVALADISENRPRSWQNISPNTYGYLQIIIKVFIVYELLHINHVGWHLNIIWIHVYILSKIFNVSVLHQSLAKYCFKKVNFLSDEVSSMYECINW